MSLSTFRASSQFDMQAFFDANAAELQLSNTPPSLPSYEIIQAMRGANPKIQRPTCTDTLVRKPGRFIVPFAGQFHSYPMRLVPHPSNENIWLILPPIPNMLREGLVVVDGELYFVKIEDLRRRLVRKSRHIPVAPKRPITYQDFIDGFACTPTHKLPDSHHYSTVATNARRLAAREAAEATPTQVVAQPEGLLDGGSEQGPGVLEERRLLNEFYEEQVHSIHDIEDQEAEW